MIFFCLSPLSMSCKVSSCLCYGSFSIPWICSIMSGYYALSWSSGPTKVSISLPNPRPGGAIKVSISPSTISLIFGSWLLSLIFCMIACMFWRCKCHSRMSYWLSWSKVLRIGRRTESRIFKVSSPNSSCRTRFATSVSFVTTSIDRRLLHREATSEQF